MKKIVAIAIFAALFGCSNSDTNAGKTKSSNSILLGQPLQINNGEEEGWGADIRLSIVDKSANDTANSYKAISSYQGKELGLLVVIPKQKGGEKGFGQGISIQSIGAASDKLLHVLANLYQQPIGAKSKFVKHIQLSYVNLKEFAKAVTGSEGEYSSTKQYKLFFEGKGDEGGAELYLNIDETANWIEIREKDQEYRSILLRFLTD